MSRYTLTDAHRNLAALVDEARYTGQPVTITDHGTPTAALISPQLLERYRALEDAADQAIIDAIRARGPAWTSDDEAQGRMDEIEAEVIQPETPADSGR